MQKNVAIIYGFTEGPLHAKKLLQELGDQSFVVVDQVEQADVIVTHSGGCYVIPSNIQASLVLMCGVPHWPNKSLPLRLTQKSIQDFLGYHNDQHTFLWLKKMNWNIYYFFRHLIRWFKMWRAYHRERQLQYVHIPRVVVVYNQHDHFADFQAVAELTKKRHWQLQILTGQHDDLWDNPKPYVDILSKVCRPKNP